MPERLHVHVPFRQLEEAVPFLLEQRLQPEIAFQGPDLDDLDAATLRRLAARFAGAGLAVTVHAPFHDLNPGALEPLVAEATAHRCRQTLEAAERLGACLVVLHPGYEYWKYGGQPQLWLEPSRRFWPPFLERAAAAGIVLALENIFEQGPETLAALLAELDSPWFGHCLDIGHWNLFAKTPLTEWFAALGPRTVHLHLHDNSGQGDEHLPPGEGVIDFPLLFRLVSSLPAPPRMTLEVHDPAGLQRALAAIAPLTGR